MIKLFFASFLATALHVFLTLYRPHGKSVSDQARNLLVQPGGRSRIQLLWSAVSDIEQLTEALFGVAEDFIHHRNVDEAMLSFRELDGPGVGHEIVRQVILVSLNHGVEGEELCAKLLGTMFSSNTISRFSMVSNFVPLYAIFAVLFRFMSYFPSRCVVYCAAPKSLALLAGKQTPSSA